VVVVVGLEEVGGLEEAVVVEHVRLSLRWARLFLL